jgi:hypothetical protein
VIRLLSGAQVKLSQSGSDLPPPETRDSPLPLALATDSGWLLCSPLGGSKTRIRARSTGLTELAFRLTVNQ